MIKLTNIIGAFGKVRLVRIYRDSGESTEDSDDQSSPNKNLSPVKKAKTRQISL